MSQSVYKIHDFKGIDEGQEALFRCFDSLGIAHETYEHPAIFTVEEGLALNLPSLIPGQHGKSLFVTDGVGGLWLIVVCEQHRADLKGLAKQVGAKRFSFVKPDLMLDTLQVTPGSVTPFALLNDPYKSIRVILDETFLDSAQCVFHPMDNRYSTVIAVADLVRFIKQYGQEALILPVA